MVLKKRGKAKNNIWFVHAFKICGGGNSE